MTPDEVKFFREFAIAHNVKLVGTTTLSFGTEVEKMETEPTADIVAFLPDGSVVQKKKFHNSMNPFSRMNTSFPLQEAEWAEKN